MNTFLLWLSSFILPGISTNTYILSIQWTFQIAHNRKSIIYSHLLSVWTILYPWHCSEIMFSLQCRQNERGGVPNHLRLNCLINRLFSRTSTKISKLRVSGLCEGNPLIMIPLTHGQKRGIFFHIWWRHHILIVMLYWKWLCRYSTVTSYAFGVNASQFHYITETTHGISSSHHINIWKLHFS